MVHKYEYQQLFQLINTQSQEEKEKKNKKPPTNMEKILSKGMRALDYPTADNITDVIKVITKTDKDVKPTMDDRSKYIYRTS
jgi:hypothetical protein